MQSKLPNEIKSKVQAIDFCLTKLDVSNPKNKFESIQEIFWAESASKELRKIKIDLLDVATLGGIEWIKKNTPPIETQHLIFS